MSSPTFWASLCCGCAPWPGGVRLGFGLGGGGGAGSGLEGGGGILFGFLSCPRASRCAGLGGTAEEPIQATGQKKHSRAREKREATYVSKNNQVTRRKLGKKTSMAESKYTAQYFRSKKDNQDKTRGWREGTRVAQKTLAQRETQVDFIWLPTSLFQNRMLTWVCVVIVRERRKKKRTDKWQSCFVFRNKHRSHACLHTLGITNWWSGLSICMPVAKLNVWQEVRNHGDMSQSLIGALPLSVCVTDRKWIVWADLM